MSAPYRNGDGATPARRQLSRRALWALVHALLTVAVLVGAGFDLRGRQRVAELIAAIPVRFIERPPTVCPPPRCVSRAQGYRMSQLVATGDFECPGGTITHTLLDGTILLSCDCARPPGAP